MSTGLKLGENWDDVPKFSVILSGTRDGGPYKREDFLVGLAGIIRNVSTRVLGKKKYLFLSWPSRTCFVRAARRNGNISGGGMVDRQSFYPENKMVSPMLGKFYRFFE